MKITLLCVGKIKEDFYKKAIAEYAKRLSRYCKLEIIEVADEKTPDEAGEKEKEKIKKLEGERILKHVRSGSYVYAMAIEGKQRASEEMAEEIKALSLSGKSSLTFVIGGSLGLSGEVVKRADESLSFSKMTFPHQLMRVILLEQIYRSFKIIQKEPYHK